MKKPNFFILGAPKCGTSSLSTWLSSHPNIFFSPIKEPRFFNYDFLEREVYYLSKYEKLFCKANNQHIAIGEASASYLYSRTAVPAILAYTNNPRFIVMLRNPVDMVYSLHEQAVFDGYEKEKDFNHAWNLQKVRIYGDCMPKTMADPQRLFYGERCKIGLQLKRLFEHVPREKILILNLDKIKENPRSEYLKVLNFLKLKDDNRHYFPVINKAKERKFSFAWDIISRTNKAFQRLGFPHTHLGIYSFMDHLTRKERSRQPMGKEIRHRLQEYFANDILLIERLTGWDLSQWKSDK